MSTCTSLNHVTVLQHHLIDELTVWCLKPFSPVFQLFCDGQYTYPCFPEVLLTSRVPTPRTVFFFPSHWLLFHITIVETIDSGERRKNPIAMSINNLWGKKLTEPGSKHQPALLKSSHVLGATD